MTIIRINELTGPQIVGDECAVCGAADPQQPVTILRLVEVKVCPSHKGHASWCVGHDDTETNCRINIGQAVIHSKITAEINIVRQGGQDWVQLLSGTDSQRRNTAFTVDQSETLAWLGGMLTTDEMHTLARELRHAVNVIRRAANVEGR